MAEDRGFKKSIGNGNDSVGSRLRGLVGRGRHGYSPDVGEGSARTKRGGDLAFEGRDTQAGSRSQGGAIYNPSKAAAHVGESINAQGNTLAYRRVNRGRIFKGRKGNADRPVGVSHARDTTGVNPLNSVTGDLFLPRT